VLAFEPEPRNFALLTENARRARWRNIIPIRAAVGSTTGTTRLWVSPKDGGDHRTVAAGGVDDRPHIEVVCWTIDEFARRRRAEIHFAKMDIQGAEGEALRGRRDTLASPAFQGLVVEFWPEALRRGGEDPAAILEQIRRAGLRCASHPSLDTDPAGFLSSVPEHGSQDLLFLRA
jgi:FkbM family methyltransferase